MLAKSAGVLSDIYTHRFNDNLAKATLSRSLFNYYLEQDGYYLNGFSKALRLLSHRCDNQSHVQQFSQLSLRMIASEQKIHQQYLRPKGITGFFSKSRSMSEPSAAVTDYIDYLCDTAYRAPVPVAVASCLPCFTIYRSLGEQMKIHCHAGHPYHQWITSYFSVNFIKATDAMVQTVNELSDPSLEQEMLLSFDKSARYERDLFDEVLKGPRTIRRVSDEASSLLQRVSS